MLNHQECSAVHAIDPPHVATRSENGSPRVKILYLSPGCFDKGGISRYNRYQISALRHLVGEKNVRTYSVLGPDDKSFEAAFDVTYAAGGVRTLQKLSYAARLIDDAVKFKPQLVLSAHVNLSGLCVFASKLTGARSALNVYGLEIWSGMSRDAEWGMRHSNYVISDCHFTAQYMIDHHHRTADSISVAWDCVDTSRFFPASPAREVLAKYGIPDPDSGVNLLTLGRLSLDAAHKGYERLLNVFASIARQCPSLRLIFAGRGEMADFLKQTAESLGLASRVFITGSIHEDDLPHIYRSAQIFSLVSDRGKGRGEGIPLTPLEAAACGVPILVGNQDGSQEAVIDGHNGFVLEPFDLEEHARKILLLATTPQLRVSMGNAARKRIDNEFTYPVFVNKHANLLSSWFGNLNGSF